MSTVDWVSTALADDAVVVEILLRLKQSMSAASPPLLPQPRPTTLAWGCRHARSKLSSATVKKDRDLMMRSSPTTPLSWRFGGASSSTSPSEDSCRLSDLSVGGRSKEGAYTNDSIACSSANKRSISKRTKSFVELQEEETLLLKERSNLEKHELETMHGALKAQKVKSENFKRLKTDLHQQSALKLASKSYFADDKNIPQAKGTEGSRIDHVTISHNIQMHDDHKEAANSLKAEKGFILPDLNMMPLEDDFA